MASGKGYFGGTMNWNTSPGKNRQSRMRTSNSSPGKQLATPDSIRVVTGLPTTVRAASAARAVRLRGKILSLLMASLRSRFWRGRRTAVRRAGGRLDRPQVIDHADQQMILAPRQRQRLQIGVAHIGWHSHVMQLIAKHAGIAVIRVGVRLRFGWHLVHADERRPDQAFHRLGAPAQEID